MSVSILVPVVQSASMSPNPANINNSVSLTVSVVEQTIVLDEIYPYCGQANIYCGGVIYIGN